MRALSASLKTSLFHNFSCQGSVVLLSIQLFFLHELPGFYLGTGTRHVIPRDALFEDVLWSPRTASNGNSIELHPNPSACHASVLPIYQTSSSLKSVELPQELGQYLLVGISMNYLVSLVPFFSPLL